MRVISLLKHYEIPFKVYYVDLNELKINIEINHSVIFIDDININEYSSVWFRRCNFYSYLNLYDLDFSSYELREYLSNEKKTLFNFILKSIEKMPINKIGSPSFLDYNKLEILKIAQEVGFTIPNTQITNYRNLIKIEKPISKPISEVFLRKIKNRIYETSTQEIPKLNQLNEYFFYSLFQENIPKKIECKSVFFNSKIYTLGLLTQDYDKTKTDSRNYSYIDEIKMIPINIPNHFEILIQKFFNKIKLNFGIIDFIITPEFDFIFLELNPFGQFDDIVEIGNYELYEDIVQFLNKKK